MTNTPHVQNSEELKYLLTDAKQRLKNFLRDIKRVKKHIDPSTYQRTLSQAQKYIQELDEVSIDRAFEYLRTHQTLFGALITSTDWQSPSFAHTMLSQAGRETGKIYATINDYKRDQHWDAYRYEQTFKKEYIDSFIKFPIHVDATSSGMAAFTTILGFLIGEQKIDHGVLMGASVYFENKELITKNFPSHVTVVDEAKTDELIKKIKNSRPSVIFLDSLTNSQHIVVPDINTIIRNLLSVKEETYLIIDNTGLSIVLQPLKHIVWKRTNLRLILFESLNKYHQFGFDRVTGGIIISYGKGTEKIFDYRVHMGTNIPDASAASLPTPNRKMLTLRLLHHKKNTTYITSELQNWIAVHPNSPFIAVRYPMYGCYFTIQFTQQYSSVRFYKKFIHLSIAIAKKRNAHLVSGSSFGLNTTRIYLTAVRSRPTTPFVRIAVGTEDNETIQLLCSVFLEVFSHFK